MERERERERERDRSSEKDTEQTEGERRAPKDDRKKIHYLFFNIGDGELKNYKHFTLYSRNMEITRQLHPDWEVIVWDRTMVND